jgi:hypothetical protein
MAYQLLARGQAMIQGLAEKLWTEIQKKEYLNFREILYTNITAFYRVIQLNINAFYIYIL